MVRKQRIQIHSNTNAPLIVAVEMGYGHLRAAHNLADSFGTEITRMDLPPVAGAAEAAVWRGLLALYNSLSKACDSQVTGRAAKALLEQITGISPRPCNGHVEPANFLARLAEPLTGRIFCKRLRAMATRAEGPVIATYPAAAVAAARASGTHVFCLATDTDLNRAWAPPVPANSRIEYFSPIRRVAERLQSFGVPASRIHMTGFPLPEKLVSHARGALARRLHRLDPGGSFRSQAKEFEEIAALHMESIPASKNPIAITLAVGGAGGQMQHARQILGSLCARVRSGELRLTLVAGTRADVAGSFCEMVREFGLIPGKGSVEILSAPTHRAYFRQFEDCLVHTDVLWTKPSELVFYAALGLPVLLAPPLGGQEHANRDWLLSNDAALDAGDPSRMDQRLQDLLASGELCRVACNAYSRLDRDGLRRIQAILFTHRTGRTAENDDIR